MEISNATIYDFSSIFKGNSQAHGVFIPGPEVSDGQKRTGTASTKVEFVGDELYESHLRGSAGLGIVPVRSDGTCSFAVIDVDKYDTSFSSILRAIYRYGIPLVPFRSKSGGLHLYLFLQTVVEAKQVLKTMHLYRKLFQLSKSTEVFPKQFILKEGEIGSWINIPYFGAEHTKQYMLSQEGEPYDLESAIYAIKERAISVERLKGLADELPLNDGPPCLQSIYTMGATSERNQYLFSLARYYKATKGDDFEFALLEANNELTNPLPVPEISDTIIKTHKKKSYSYKCQEEPICSLCDKAVCRERKYGIGGSAVSDISYEEFIQHGTEDPYYEWIINGKPLKFFNESDIISQNSFREQCFRELHILPFKLTDFNWTEVVNIALHNVVLASETAGELLTPSTMFRAHLVEFLTKRAQAQTQEQILVDRVYLDKDINAYVFRPHNLSVFLIQQKQFRAYGPQQINDKLRSMGGMPRTYYIKKTQRTTRVWILPVENLSKYVGDSYQDVAIDFLDEVPKDEY